MINHTTDTIESKSCRICRAVLSAEEFHVAARRQDGSIYRRNECRHCTNARIAAWRDRQGQAGRTKAAEITRQWRKDNSAQDIENHRRWREAHPDKMREVYRKQRAKNRQRRKDYNCAWRKANPDKVRNQKHRRQARKTTAPATLTAGEWRDTLAYFGHACAYCGRTDVRLERDHILPLSRGGGYTKYNIVPACRSCNASKRDYIPEEAGMSFIKPWPISGK